MSMIFAGRSSELERIDLETMDGATTARVMAALERTNRWLGGAQATLNRLEHFSHRWEKGARIRFVDWGTGGADMPRAIVRWCRRRGFRAEIVAVDNNAAIVAYARQACAAYPEITVTLADLNAFSPAPASFDYALSSLTLHHLSNPEIIDLLKRSDRVARRGLIMNDLIRSARAWAWIWTLSRLLHAPEMFQDDAPLSVKRAFTKSELFDLAQQAGLPYLSVKTHFGYRYTLAGEK
jgi:hypothetical protein